MPAEPTGQMRVPPQFLEGERAILGGLLLDNDALPKVMAVLSPDDFYREAHRNIFKAMMELFNKNEPVDWITLTAILKEQALLESVGGHGFLAELSDAVPSAANILHYTKVVKEKSVLRQVIGASTEIGTRCYEDHANIDEFLDEAEQLIFKVGESRIQKGFEHIHSIVKVSFADIERNYERGESVTGVASGFPDLDALTAGFQRSDLVIIAGRPSMGKTSFALNVGMHAAIDIGIPTGIFSLEMSKEQLALRMLCARAGVDLKKLRTGYLAKADWGKLIQAVGNISDAPFYIDDTPAINTFEVRAKARRLKKEIDLGLIIVDYLQLMRGATKYDSREKEISEISRSLKALAKELDVPVVALSQLNRKVEERPNKRPQLADLRESGAIEQDADVIIFIYRDEVYNKSEDNPKKGEAEIIIGKQRNGPIGLVKVLFQAEFSTFRPLSHREDTPESGDDSAILSNI